MNTLAPEWISRNIVDRSRFTYGGEEHTYLVVSAQFAIRQQAPAIFTILNNGVLAVSDAYPWSYRKLGLIHELVEQTLPESIYQCVNSLCVELQLARTEGMCEKHYVNFRKKFFEDLIAYYEKKAHRSPSEDLLIMRMRYSLAHLVSLLTDWPA